MPTPPVVAYSTVFSIGDTLGYKNGMDGFLYTWAQLRTPITNVSSSVYAPYSNTSHHYEYNSDFIPGLIIETKKRLFRGDVYNPFASFHTEYDSGGVAIHQWIEIAGGFSSEDLKSILIGSVWTGAQTITINASAVDGISEYGQEIDATPPVEDTITSIELVF